MAVFFSVKLNSRKTRILLYIFQLKVPFQIVRCKAIH